MVPVIARSDPSAIRTEANGLSFFLLTLPNFERRPRLSIQEAYRAILPGGGGRPAVRTELQVVDGHNVWMSVGHASGGRPRLAGGLSELDVFYRRLVTGLRRRRVPCAITGGLACVEFGVVEHTEDCDLICQPAGAETLLAILAASEFRTGRCRYRSALSAPLDRRWLGGGWTSHFTWGTGRGECPYLDVFGVPPRVTGPWERNYRGPFADRATVAEMKRTRRRKDWDQATALGLQMLKRGDEAGWLQLFDADVLAELAARLPRPRRLIGVRPVLGLDPRLGEVLPDVRLHFSQWTA